MDLSQVDAYDGDPAARLSTSNGAAGAQLGAGERASIAFSATRYKVFGEGRGYSVG